MNNYSTTTIFLMTITVLCVNSSIYASFNNIENNEYDGFSLHKIILNSQQDVEFILKYLDDFKHSVNSWTNLVAAGSNGVDILVEPSFRETFLNDLDKWHIKHQLSIGNVGELIQEQLSRINSRISSSRVGGNDEFDYGKYHTLDEINDWMDQLAEQYKSLIKVFNVSRSYEGRTIRAFKISAPSNSTNSKKAIWFDGGIHSREWISPATVIYMTNELVSKYGKDIEVTQLLDTFDFYSLPVFNVDGYAYTFQNASTRLWRKTRSINPGSECLGADPNRNWDTHFCEEGASKDPCDDTYCGGSAFSEIELKLVADFLRENKDSIVCYMNIHAYSQLWMSPYGYSSAKPKNFNILNEGGRLATEAIKKLYGTEYKYGPISEIIYVASGSSADWTFDALNIFFSYGVELRDTGKYGFILPEDQILPTAKETFEAIKALANYIKSDPFKNASNKQVSSSISILMASLFVFKFLF